MSAAIKLGISTDCPPSRAAGDLLSVLPKW
jgi:hypothetical protein